MTDDKVIRDLVVEELDFDPSVTSAGIGVAVSKGVVTLSGHVPSYFEQEAAVTAAMRVRGVKAVAQELQVRLAGMAQRSDDEIAGRAVSILNWTMPGEHDVTAVIENGWVTLGGQVEWGYQRRSAEQAIRKLRGVTGITNQISIRPRVKDIDIKQTIVDAFKRNAELEGANISVKVDGSTVTLAGTVRAYFERHLAEEAAWRVPGVTQVTDRITIV